MNKKLYELLDYIFDYATESELGRINDEINKRRLTLAKRKREGQHD